LNSNFFFQKVISAIPTSWCEKAFDKVFGLCCKCCSKKENASDDAKIDEITVTNGKNNDDSEMKNRNDSSAHLAIKNGVSSTKHDQPRSNGVKRQNSTISETK
jgi:hypothetical protein